MRGRIEAQITVPSPGWRVAATNSIGGPTTCTVAAGTYYLSSLITALQTALNTSRPSGWTVTAALGEASSQSGLVTINCSNGPWALSWTDLNLRNALGFAGNGNIASHSGATVALSQSGSVWMPDCAYWAPCDPQADRGFLETDMRQTESPGKDVKGLVGNTKRVIEGMRWDAVTAARARPIGTTAFTDWDTFYSNTQIGGLSYHVVNAKLALYPNADSASFYEYKLVGVKDTKTPQTVSGFAGLYRVTLPRLVYQP